MGFQTQSTSHRRSGSGITRRSSGALADINVTPLVDVMLVLLIVFMISAPMMQQGVQVDLPKAQGQALDEQKEPIVLVIHKDQHVTINENTVATSSLDGFERKLKAIYANKEAREIFVQADQAVPYGFVARVMALIKKAGITKVGLVTREETK